MNKACDVFLVGQSANGLIASALGLRSMTTQRCDEFVDAHTCLPKNARERSHLNFVMHWHDASNATSFQDDATAMPSLHKTEALQRKNDLQRPRHAAV
jgi:hypothetical protein